MIPVRLDWARHIDGVQFFDEGRKRACRPSTERTERLSLEVSNLEDPVSLRFVNAGTDEKRIGEFLRRFGPPRRSASGAYSITEIANMQADLGSIVKSGNWGPAEKAVRLNACLTNTQLRPSVDVTESGVRISVHADDLYSLMAMELASAVEVGAALTSCEHCGTHYFTGPLTGRRSHSKFCSDRCRVAAMRERNVHGTR